MQERGGKNNSPPGWFSSAGPGWFWPSTDGFSLTRPGRFWPSYNVLVGQTDSGPALLAGPGLAQTKIGEFVGPSPAQPLLGLSPAQLVGSAQPT